MLLTILTSHAFADTVYLDLQNTKLKLGGFFGRTPENHSYTQTEGGPVGAEKLTEWEKKNLDKRIVSINVNSTSSNGGSVLHGFWITFTKKEVAEKTEVVK